MELNELKKSEVDEPRFDEKILLATHGINWLAIRSEKVYQQLVHISEATKGDIHKKSIQHWQELRNDILKKITSVLEEFGNFVEGRGATDNLDGIVTTPSYDILYERYAEDPEENNLNEKTKKQ
jgi:hypothetical protein